MSAKVMNLDLLASLTDELGTTNPDLLRQIFSRGMREIKIDQALDQYAHGEMTFGAASELAGVSRSELARHAHARGLTPPSSVETLAEELG